MRLPWFTPDQRYFQMFTALAGQIVTAADLLSKVLDDPKRATELVPRINGVEYEADRLMHEMDERLDRAFITPMDREDINALAYRLDGVIDLLDGTARRLVMFHIDGPPPGMPGGWRWSSRTRASALPKPFATFGRGKRWRCTCGP